MSIAAWIQALPDDAVEQVVGAADDARMDCGGPRAERLAAAAQAFREALLSLAPTEMQAFDAAEFEELLREVVALREWKAAHEAAAFAPERAPTDLLLRKLLWLRHGCDGLYGDDGEMQCGRCLIDFKRMSPAEIQQRWHTMGLANYAASLGASAERAAPPKEGT